MSMSMSTSTSLGRCSAFWDHGCELQKRCSDVAFAGPYRLSSTWDIARRASLSEARSAPSSCEFSRFEQTRFLPGQRHANTPNFKEPCPARCVGLGAAIFTAIILEGCPNELAPVLLSDGEHPHVTRARVNKLE
jgi:hypothetical protein